VKQQRVMLLCAIVRLLCDGSLASYAQNTVSFSINSPGITKSVAEWGVDTAWPSYDNVRQSIAHIGANNVDVYRLTFHPAYPLSDNGNGSYSLSATAKGFIDNQLALAGLGGTKPLALLPGEFSPPFDATHWLRTIKATQEYINSKAGWSWTPIKSVEVFNEPDYWAGQGSTSQLNNLITQLKAYPAFQNTEFPAGSTLNSNNAWAWYDPVTTATQGSSHLLGGSLTNWVNFSEHVKSTGKEFVNPELHSLGEAIVGAEHGMTSGIFWGDALRARGLFAQASDGKRLGYFEDLSRQSAAAVYRAPDGNVYAFAGGLERFGAPTAYRFVSTDADVYFNGIPVREYMLQTKFDETDAVNPAGNDFENYGSWSNQGAYADIDTEPGIPALDGYRWKIVNRQTGLVLEVANGGTGDGATIRGAIDSSGLNQKWNIERTRNGYYHLYNANSDRTAEVAGSSLDNGASVRQWGTADNQTQQWYIEETGDGYFFIRNGYSNKYMTSSRSTITQWDQSGSAGQQWQFVLANPDPSEGLATHYKFESNASDSVASNHATVSGNPRYAPGKVGQAIDLDGADDFATLPSGVANSKDITIAAWVKWDGGNAWQRIFDFGDDTTSYMFLTPRSGANTMRFAITTGGGNAEQILETTALPAGEWVHLAVTLGGNTGILYVNGEPRVAGQILLDPSDISPVNNYIGKSQWPDPLLNGLIDDFRIYDFALDMSQVADLVFSGADFDHDGDVDGNDLIVWQSAYGQNALGDADGDGNSDGRDFLIWQRSFEAGASVGAATTVPEPVSAWLILFAVVFPLRRRLVGPRE
jgi:hypothetical protein